ncbi:MAG: hypothetical protein Q4B35_05390 [Slackia sp.]|nr:hypothetical protein [Slackia sp.]
MLLILTGDVQIGKTRWLQRAVSRLESAHVACHGVLAPGVWKDDGRGSFEKLGIDNLLLPSHELVPFARRADLAVADGLFDPQSQAGRAQLKWHISDKAIVQVNDHFAHLRTVMRDKTAQKKAGCGAQSERAPRALCAHRAASTATPSTCGVLFVDELGQLELLRGEGLVEAMKALEGGPIGFYAHAIVIARDKFGLPDRVEEAFAGTWGGSARIAPDDEAWRTWIEPLLNDENAPR